MKLILGYLLMGDEEDVGSVTEIEGYHVINKDIKMSIKDKLTKVIKAIKNLFKRKKETSLEDEEELYAVYGGD
jgi:hypothetical protein